MTTSTITRHRPAPFIAAAAVAAAVVAGSVALSVAHHASAPGQQLQGTYIVHTQRVHHFHPLTSGGRVMLGE